MIAILSFLFICFSRYVLAEVSQLSLNPKSTISADVQSVAHDSGNREVSIELKSTRKCEYPTFIVRLSGPSMYTLDMKAPTSGEAGTFRYSYPLLVDKGKYNLEVLILYCKKVEKSTIKEVCVESVQDGANIVNLPYSFQVSASKVNETRGRWIYAPWEYRYIPTRHQSAQHNDYVQLEYFSYVDGRPLHRNLVKAVALLNSTAPYTINVCMVGTTHAAELIDPGHFVNFDLEGNVRFLHFPSKQPGDLNVTKVFHADCGYVVLDYGDDSFRGSNIPSVESFLTDMRTLIKRVSRPEYEGPLQFFVRSMHYAPLNEQASACPPTDIRTPPIANLINTEVKAIAAEFDVGYIDLSRVQAPMWDATKDWVHFLRKVYYAEVAWIVNDFFEYSVSHQRAPRVDPGLTSLPNNTPVRYQDERQVYLYRDGKLRAIPDGHTFIALGLDFDQVVVLYNWKKKYQAASMGDAMPHQ